MASEGSGSRYDLTELFVIKFVLADVVIIFTLIFAGPIYALAITALLVVAVVLVWFLVERVGSAAPAAKEPDAGRPESDPVTTLQEQYAAGELSDSEFETKLERVIEANERAERAGVETEDLSLERSK